jgi:hypothetical protein
MKEGSRRGSEDGNRNYKGGAERKKLKGNGEDMLRGSRREVRRKRDVEELEEVKK